jgi:hypothetical protein
MAIYGTILVGKIWGKFGGVKFWREEGGDRAREVGSACALWATCKEVGVGSVETGERVSDVRMVVSAKWKPMEKKEIQVLGGWDTAWWGLDLLVGH